MCGYAKKEKYRKNGQVSKYLKQWVLRCPLKEKKRKKKGRKKKREEKRDNPYSLAKVFKC
jgi:hypothetical protein